ncbi:Rne/Rng family ribonuclease [Phragmitibacter flavus]|uniref:Ribonuclease G n=1 Tax=Phragmitibacter flavus TaxID=2576071 RepID=A0A5R8KHV3_9BACT|nr:Rne/Rng family ribonuclease [Phragmitibacter flavus]TLD71903.1 Rne/Rng family ribonuclease [Phragmitibacter flavus]
MALAIVKKIKEFFTGQKDITSGTRIVINCERLENRVALLENGALEEYSIERVGTTHLVGSVYKGRIKNIEQGLKAMFVDIGLEKNAFLHFWDAIPEALNAQAMEEIDRGGSNRKKSKTITAKDIPSLYPIGAEILVQITKGPVGNKGPRVTTNISLAGRLLVLMPQNDSCGISRKIDDPKERARLRKIVEKLHLPEGMGIIMRTEAAGKRARHIIRDLSILVEQWNEIVERRDSKQVPICCFEEPDVFERTVRDFLTDEIDEIACDDIAVVQRMKEIVAPISRRALRRITHFTGPGSIFDRYNVQRQIDSAFYREVWLKCGGYIVIDQTEALISIDVNTGRNKGKSANDDKVILETNLEAAAEVARQLRLRNMGGLVVVDFIDMKQRRDQQAVYKTMVDHTRRDKAKTQVLPLSQFGLMEMTRQRLHESLSDALYEPCPHCAGHGQIKTPLTMSVEIQRRLSSVLQRIGETDRDLVVTIHPDVMQRLRTSDDQILVDLERKYQARMTFRTDASFNREHYIITNARTGDEIKN